MGGGIGQDKSSFSLPGPLEILPIGLNNYMKSHLHLCVEKANRSASVCHIQRFLKGWNQFKGNQMNASIELIIAIILLVITIRI